MRGIDSTHDSVGVRRDVIKTTPDRVTALWLFGIFILGSVAFVSTWIGYFLFGGFVEQAYWFGLAATLFIGSVIGWFTIIIQESSSVFKIRVIKEK